MNIFLLFFTCSIGLYLSTLIFGFTTYICLKIFNLKSFYGKKYLFKDIFFKGYKAYFEPYSITSSPEFKKKYLFE